MGIKVNASQAAQLVGRTERRVRQWIADGKLTAVQSGPRTKGERVGPSAWQIDVDNLAALGEQKGFKVDVARLSEVTAGQNRTPQGLLARVEQLERRLAILERRAQWSPSALSEPSEGRTYPDTPAYVPPTLRPSVASYSAGARPDVSDIPDDADLSGPIRPNRRRGETTIVLADVELFFTTLRGGHTTAKPSTVRGWCTSYGMSRDDYAAALAWALAARRSKDIAADLYKCAGGCAICSAYDDSELRPHPETP